jgi:hypothetical protein
VLYKQLIKLISSQKLLYVQKGIVHIFYVYTISLICTVLKLCYSAHLFPNTPRLLLRPAAATVYYSYSRTATLATCKTLTVPTAPFHGQKTTCIPTYFHSSFSLVISIWLCMCVCLADGIWRVEVIVGWYSAYVIVFV